MGQVSGSPAQHLSELSVTDLLDDEYINEWTDASKHLSRRNIKTKSSKVEELLVKLRQDYHGHRSSMLDQRKEFLKQIFVALEGRNQNRTSSIIPLPLGESNNLSSQARIKTALAGISQLAPDQQLSTRFVLSFFAGGEGGGSNNVTGGDLDVVTKLNMLTMACQHLLPCLNTVNPPSQPGSVDIFGILESLCEETLTQFVSHCEALDESAGSDLPSFLDSVQTSLSSVLSTWLALQVSRKALTGLISVVESICLLEKIFLKANRSLPALNSAGSLWEIIQQRQQDNSRIIGGQLYLSSSFIPAASASPSLVDEKQLKPSGSASSSSSAAASKEKSSSAFQVVPAFNGIGGSFEKTSFYQLESYEHTAFAISTDNQVYSWSLIPTPDPAASTAVEQAHRHTEIPIPQRVLKLAGEDDEPDVSSQEQASDEKEKNNDPLEVNSPSSSSSPQEQTEGEGEGSETPNATQSPDDQTETVTDESKEALTPSSLQPPSQSKEQGQEQLEEEEVSQNDIKSTALPGDEPEPSQPSVEVKTEKETEEKSIPSPSSSSKDSSVSAALAPTSTSTSTFTQFRPRLVSGLKHIRIIQIACGVEFGLFLAANGQGIYSMGKGSAVGHRDPSAVITTPRLIPESQSKLILHIGAGRQHALAASESQCYAWGSNSCGQLGLRSSSTSSRSKMTLVRALAGKELVQLSGGYSHSLAVTQAGQLFSWGGSTNRAGTGHGSGAGRAPVLGTGSSVPSSTPTRVDKGGLKGEVVIQASCGWDYSMCVTKSGRVYAWGLNDRGQLGTGM